MTQLLENLFALPVPEDAKVDLWERIRFGKGESLAVSKGATLLESIDLPPGNWQLIGTTKGCTEEMAREVVERFNNGSYRDYDFPRFDPSNDYLPFHLIARDSFQSLLRSKNLDTANNYALIKKV